MQNRSKPHSRTRSLSKHLFHIAAAGATTGVFALSAMAAQGAWRTYLSNDPIGRDVVKIESRAPLEVMLISTNKIRGQIKVDESDILQDPQATFEIDTASLDSGIDLRNEHMTGAQWLNVAQYPKATWTLTKVLKRPKMKYPVSLHRTANFSAEGVMDFHGVQKPIVAEVAVTPIDADKNTATRLPGNLLYVNAKFKIKLSDFGINVPEMAQLKIANEQQVEVDLFTSTELPKPPGATMSSSTSSATNSTTTSTTATVVTPKERKLDNGLIIEDTLIGTGTEAKAGQPVTVHYRGTLTNGEKFDASYDRGEPFSFKLGAGQVIKGWDQGVAGMKEGGKRKLTIPPALGYGARGAGGVIPPNATLVFEVELLKVG